jgi:hypothetical protein
MELDPDPKLDLLLVSGSALVKKAESGSAYNV